MEYNKSQNNNEPLYTRVTIEKPPQMDVDDDDDIEDPLSPSSKRSQSIRSANARNLRKAQVKMQPSINTLENSYNPIEVVPQAPVNQAPIVAKMQKV